MVQVLQVIVFPLHNLGRSLKRIDDDVNNYSYTYDENGIRTSKTINGFSTIINTQNGIVLSQKDNDNTIVFQYDEVGTPFGMVLNDEQYYYIINAQGDVIGIANQYGEAIAYYSYNEWGELIEIKDINNGYDVAEINPLRYRGYYYDNETGYYYLQSRYYDPSICRFINADSFISFVLDKTSYNNLYAYCHNNPINYYDTFGFSATAVGGAAAGAAISAAISDIIVVVLIVAIVFATLGLAFPLLEGIGGGSSIATPPPKRNDEAEAAWKKIPSSLKKDEKVDISKFNTKLKNGQGKKASNGWRIQKDTSGHKGSEWKLFDRNGNRIASLKGDGTVVGK